MKLKQLFYRVLIGSLIAIALVAIAGILTGDFGETDARVLGTIFAILLYSWTTYAQARLLERRAELSVVAIGGLVVSGLGFVTGLVPIWGDSDSEDAWRTAAIFLVLALALADIALLLGSARSTDSSSVTAIARGTIVAVSILAVGFVVEIVEERDYGDSYYRMMGVIAVLWVLGTVLTPIMRRAQATTKLPPRVDGSGERAAP